ncbi:GMC oxidoreductase [Candidatus Pelagibacter sp.]|nr:GMC oxidoreductase [Candidatus Pelagibacter sp.]
MDTAKIYDYVIIGSGPSGSVLAKNLADFNFKVALIDRAKNKIPKKNKKDFIYSPYINYSPFHYSPMFSNQLGGNSALWNNKIYLISEDEFNSSNWPFPYDELKKYSIDLAEKFDINHEDVCKIKKEKEFSYTQSIRAHKLGNLFNFLKINENKNIDIMDNSSPIKVNLDNKKQVIKSIIIKNNELGKISEIKISKAIILCAGGLGNPHLIMNLFEKHNGLIGKYLSDHPHINLSNIKKKESDKFFKSAKYFLKENTNKENNLILNIKNYFAGVQLDFTGDPFLYLRRFFLRTKNKILRKLILIFIIFLKFIFDILNKILSLIKIKGKYSYQFFFSQELNINNSIILDHLKKDEFGLSKSNINWNISQNDIRSYNKMVDQVLDKKDTNLFNKNKIFVGLHPSCTTIATDDEKSCVDKNLRLSNYKNIFISGSSVFSGNGITNPTWTIMTLSNRLSDYLRNYYK